ncbi:phosphatidate cytidylyltransferase [Gigaspora margarita]|uniref:Phosphatidate cytidylyltransferase n=1 Tax=Gigaspora margarita TaxID=4874 RepID=A0A8H4A9G9_GIGMA|nr:phosphatidate cytidylyltransferase [Gigaspora margarita]
MGFLPSPTWGTLTSLALSYILTLSIVITVEIISRSFNIPLYISRKIIHVYAGTYMFGLLYIFEQWEYAVLLTGSFVLLNFIFLRLKMFKSMHPQESATPGTVYFAFSVTFLLWWFHEGWEQGFPRGREYIAVAGIVAMTYGDAMASVIGKTYGRNGYQLIGVEGSRRTYEGSQAFFITTLIAVPFFWWLMSPSELTTTEYFTGALISASVGTALESISPWGTDNLSVPLGVSLALAILGY